MTKPPDQPIGDAIDGDFVMRDKPYSQDELRVEDVASLADQQLGGLGAGLALAALSLLFFLTRHHFEATVGSALPGHSQHQLGTAHQR